MPAVNSANTDGTSVCNKGFEKSQRAGFNSLRSSCSISDSGRVKQSNMCCLYTCVQFMCVPHLQRLINPSCCR